MLHEGIFSPGTAESFLPSVDALYQNAMQLLQDIEYEQAIATFNQLLKINPNHINALIDLGAALLRTQRPREALTMYRRALKLMPNNSDILTDIGSCFKSLGDFPKAKAFYEKAFKQQPDNIYSLYNICLDDGATPSVAKELLAFYRRADGFGQPRMLACYALGALYEEGGDYRQAFKYYNEAKTIQSGISPYDEAKIFSYSKYVQHTFNAKLHAKYKNTETSKITPIFVLGMPRSGTSLVEQILASHSSVHGAGEVDIIPYVAEKLVPRILKQNPHMQNNIQHLPISQLAAYYLERLQSYCHNNKLYIVDKTPNNFFHIGWIRILFPHAPIIHCVRDPMDTCWSIFKRNFNGGHHYSNHQETLGRYYRCYQQLMRHWHQVFPGEIHDVHYEQLVAEPERISRALLEHCQLPWQEKCLAFYRTNRIVNTASASQVRRPIYKTSLKSWEKVAKELAPLRAALQI